MRHRKDHRKLGRSPSHRRAMLRNLVTSRLDHEEVRTTPARAKEVRRIAEQIAKRVSLAECGSKRIACSGKKH